MSYVELKIGYERLLEENNHLHEKLKLAIKAIDILLDNLPDSYHPDNEAWTWCWDELTDSGQDEVKGARIVADDILFKLGNRG